MNNQSKCDNEQIESNFITLTSYITSQQRKHSDATGEFSSLIHSIQRAIKYTSKIIRSSPFLDFSSEDGEKKFDILINDIFIKSIVSSFSTGMMISEKDNEIIPITKPEQGKYIVIFDPLNSPSNFQCTPISSIFSIFRRQKLDCLNKKECFQSSHNMVAAGYVIYGCCTELVLTLEPGSGVNLFSFDTVTGEFILTKSELKLPHEGNIYSVNKSYCNEWDNATSEFVQKLKDPKQNASYNFQYIKSLIPDVHQILILGGVYLHPPIKDYPEGKLKLSTQCNPIARIITEAGGIAVNHLGIPILDLKHDRINTKSTLILGSSYEMQNYISLIMDKRNNQKENN